MGNNIKSRLHMKKKEDRPARGTDDSPVPAATNPGRNTVDQQISSGPNRARAVDTVPSSDTANVPTTTRGVDTSQTNTNTARART